jgi:ketosteroid isomerase-like protein
MASANLDLVRSIYAAWERGDFSSGEWAHPEIEYVTIGSLSPGSRTGLAGMAEGFRNRVSAWDDFHVAVGEYRELDGERVLMLVHLGGCGKTSGPELAQMRAGANLFHISDGKVTRFVLYADREHALADLGLAPVATRNPWSVRSGLTRTPTPDPPGSGSGVRAS